MINEMADGEEELCFCPSFNSYSTDGIADIAARVTGINTNDAVEDEKYADNNYDDDDFEFALVGENQGFSAEEFFSDGQIKQVFPVFNRDLSVKYKDFGKSSSDEGVESIRIPLKQFFMENRENEYPSSSSSEVDELETLTPGTYCVWRPKVSESSPSQCKKSKSTGSASKRWKFRDLLRRCNSDGKDSFIFLTPKPKEEKSKDTENSKNSTAKRVISGEKLTAKSPHETLYVRNRTIKEGEKKKSYLPYRQDLVGGLGRSFPTF
ncbi:Hypothetical predicted protein [Olea europaea subsp. europaea]|uniref:Uncharacterized protein n=1 Tax=Olea europaea subsp. europaea TaxID=158383 RepID=A0A8S0UCX8_OLEEU|nr:Hypothetical predicted protein [Olea europaea subsp. europaea]